MNKCVLAFLKSHIKKAIFELETANRLCPNLIDEATIVELKIILSHLDNSDFIEETNK